MMMKKNIKAGVRWKLVGMMSVLGIILTTSGLLMAYIYSLLDAFGLSAYLRKVIEGLFFLLFFDLFLLSGIVFFVSRKIISPLEKISRGAKDFKKDIFDTSHEKGRGDDGDVMIDALRRGTEPQEYLGRIIGGMSDILFVVNSYGLIALANKRACEVLGYREEELKGKDAADIFSKQDRYIVGWGLKGQIDEGSLKDKKINLVAKSGKEIEIYLCMRSLHDGNNNFDGLVCLAKDVQQISQMLGDFEKSTQETLKKLREMKEDLLQAEKMVSLGQIAAGVAHEIHNSLFAISGELEMLTMDASASSTVKESVKMIREQVSRMSEILKRLLEFSRKREINFAPVDVGSLLDKVVVLLGYQAKFLEHIEIAKEISPEPLIVEGDQNQLQEVFLNLMINAVQAMERAGGVLTIRTFLEECAQAQVLKNNKADKLVCIQFSDTGLGMTEEVKKKIFNPFFTTKKTGTGLGLSVCFGIIEDHKGTIDVESQPETGTTFTVKIPLLKKTER